MTEYGLQDNGNNQDRFDGDHHRHDAAQTFSEGLVRRFPGESLLPLRACFQLCCFPFLYLSFPCREKPSNSRSRRVYQAQFSGTATEQYHRIEALLGGVPLRLAGWRHRFTKA